MFRNTELRYKRVHACTVVEKNVWITERFYDNRYNVRAFFNKLSKNECKQNWKTRICGILDFHLIGVLLWLLG